MRRHRLGLAALAALLVTLPSAAHAADYHHVHLAAPNVAEAVQWYITNIGCTAMNRPDACLIGTTQVIFANRKPDAGSQGSGVDHIGFSFPDPPPRPSYPEARGLRHLAFEVVDIDAAVSDLQGHGVRVEPVRVDEYTGRRYTFVERSPTC